MKTTTRNLGLYKRVTLIPENEDDNWDIWHELDNSLDDYIGGAEKQAKRIAQGANSGRQPNSPEVVQALDIIDNCRSARRALEDPVQRHGLFVGILLAQSVGHLRANLAWQKPVFAGKGSIKGGHKGAEATHGPKGSKGKKYRVAYEARRKAHPDETKMASRKAVGELFGVGYKTIERHTIEKR